jgi:hypothetical protein
MHLHLPSTHHFPGAPAPGHKPLGNVTALLRPDANLERFVILHCMFIFSNKHILWPGLGKMPGR